MPLVYQQNINAFTKLGVWHIKEGESFFLQRVPLQKNINHPHKRLQHLAGRILLCELFEDFPLDLILIADTRKPFLADEEYHFSISHCGDYAAAIVSKKNRVGVDIEIPQAKILGMGYKFLQPAEQEILTGLTNDPVRLFTMAWSVKEALFKWHGHGNLDFKEHMMIDDCVLTDNEFTAHCTFSKAGSIKVKVHGLFFNGNCLTWLAT
jgi:phosphopantetheinyl transferase